FIFVIWKRDERLHAEGPHVTVLVSCGYIISWSSKLILLHYLFCIGWDQRSNINLNGRISDPTVANTTYIPAGSCLTFSIRTPSPRPIACTSTGLHCMFRMRRMRSTGQPV